MRKYLSLTRVLLKNSMGMMSDGKSKKTLNVILYGVLALCMIPLSFTLYMMFDTAIVQLQALQQEELFWRWAFTSPLWLPFCFPFF